PKQTQTKEASALDSNCGKPIKFPWRWSHWESPHITPIFRAESPASHLSITSKLLSHSADAGSLKTARVGPSYGPVCSAFQKTTPLSTKLTSTAPHRSTQVRAATPLCPPPSGLGSAHRTLARHARSVSTPCWRRSELRPWCRNSSIFGLESRLAM